MKRVSKIVLGVFLGASLAQWSIANNFFTGVEQNGEFLEKTQVEVARDAEKLLVEFTEEEARGLREVVSDVRDLLRGNFRENLLQSDLQEDLLLMEKQWKQREGAWIVVKLLEGIRIKSQLYLQNAYLAERIPDQNSSIYRTSIARMQRYKDGVSLSNNTLEEIVDEGSPGSR